MSGIYIHIPFCKSRCTYCDFYTRTTVVKKPALLRALLAEIEERHPYLTERVETVYFGGGTPSLLSAREVADVLRALRARFTIAAGAEITLEANPDDLSAAYLRDLRQTGVNRLSIGVQSFDNAQLHAIRRRHSGEAAVQSVERATQAGFENISIDLIYGLPQQTLPSWKEQVERALALDVQHLSAYSLTYEPNTLLWRQRQAGKVAPTADETVIAMYNHLVAACSSAGWEQYEISNWAKPGFRSRHNSSYWAQQPYIGIGPSAHSYNVRSRQWNVASIARYCELVGSGQPYFEQEMLTPQDQYNDFVMVSLRTMQGISLQKLEAQFGKPMLDSCISSAARHLRNRLLQTSDGFLRLTPAGVMLSDGIIADLMQV